MITKEQGDIKKRDYEYRLELTKNNCLCYENPTGLCFGCINELLKRLETVKQQANNKEEMNVSKIS